MYIAAIRIAAEFGRDLIGIQYQQGLKELVREYSHAIPAVFMRGFLRLEDAASTRFRPLALARYKA